jgi:hypothetical protein
VFNPGRTRSLEVLSFHNMDTAFVGTDTIRLRGIREASKVCARLETRALYSIGMRIFELRNGPFMRRFPHGYFPLQMSRPCSRGSCKRGSGSWCTKGAEVPRILKRLQIPHHANLTA